MLGIGGGAASDLCSSGTMVSTYGPERDGGESFKRQFLNKGDQDTSGGLRGIMRRNEV